MEKITEITDFDLFVFQQEGRFNRCDNSVPTFSGFQSYLRTLEYHEKEDLKEWLDTTKDGVNYVNRLITKGSRKRKRGAVDLIHTTQS